MYLSKMQIQNYRMIHGLQLDLRDGINTIIGENNTGKTAIIDALRICLGLIWERREIYVTRDDFHIDENGKRTDEIKFDLTFDGLTDKEKGIFIEMLAVSDNVADTLQLHIRFYYDQLKDRIKREYWGGENEGQIIPVEVLELLYFVHLGALRDATRDLSPSRGNQLSKLFLKLVPDEKEQDIYAQEVNEKIRSLPTWQGLLADGKNKIQEHLSQFSLRNNPQAVNIGFVDREFRKILEGLRMQIPFVKLPEGDYYELDIWQNGLGYNNLIYASAVLGDLHQRRLRDPGSYIALLIEEPEAHLHPQLQNIFLGYLEKITRENIQVFITSHSPTLTAHTDINSLVIVTINGNSLCAQSISKIDLEANHIKYLQRFLDVTKSQMLFSKGIILVEGISEALLLPSFAGLLGDKYDLKANGAEVVNIGGTAFEHFAKLFNSQDKNKRLDIRCAIVTDDDRIIKDGEDDYEISSRAQNALKLKGGLVDIFLARVTFEYELYIRNESLVKNTYSNLHPETNLEFTGDLDSRASQFVELIKRNKDKAEFAQFLALKIELEHSYKDFVVPEYIENSIKWVVGNNENSTD